MREGIPDEIIAEIAPLGGIKGISDRIFSKRSLGSLAESYKILSEPIRLQILLVLGQGKFCVCVLKKITSCPDTRLSYHLAVLKNAGLISSERKKSYLRYFLTRKGKDISNEILKMVELHSVK